MLTNGDFWLNLFLRGGFSHFEKEALEMDINDINILLEPYQPWQISFVIAFVIAIILIVILLGCHG